MKKVLLLSLLMFNGFSAEFLSNQDCISVYRDGYLELKEATEQFNADRLDRWQYPLIVSGLSTEISAHRAACSFSESPSTKDCVESYKEIYKGLRSKIKLSAIMSGNQRKVAFTESMQTVIDTERVEREDDSVLGKISRFLKVKKGTIVEEVKKARDITMIEYLDSKCDQ